VQDEQGNWRPVREPLTPRVLMQHRDGQITVGTYVVKPPDLARTLVFDIDDKDEREQEKQLTAVTKVLADLGLDYTVEFSGKKGWHVWVVAEDYMPAATLYQLGRGIRQEIGLPNLEVFPKQTTVRDLGNLVKLPGGIHRVTGKHNDLLGSEGKQESVESLTLAAAKYPEVAARMARSGDVLSTEYPCVHSLQDGVMEGSRNIGLFHLATMLRKFSISDEGLEFILRKANDRCDPPLDETELTSLIDNSRYSGPTCDQLPGDYHCGDQCIKSRHPGLYTRSGALRYAADGEEVVLRVARRVDDGLMVELEHPDAVQVRANLGEPKARKT